MSILGEGFTGFDSVKEFRPGERIELAAHTDTWMRGDRFGRVERLGRHYLHVKMDRSQRMLRVHPVAVGRKV